MTDDTSSASSKAIANIANIAVIGCGWWTQGWHLPALDHNRKVKLMAIVDTSNHPKSTLNPNLESMSMLEQKYQTKAFSSVIEMLQCESIGPFLDGILIATPHATHYNVYQQIIMSQEMDRRRQKKVEEDNKSTPIKPLHILMEKPMTTDITHALELYNLVQQQQTTDNDNNDNGNLSSSSQFWINHSANYRKQAKIAKEMIQSGKLGRIRHINGFFASPLKWIFEDPGNTGWNEPSHGMLGNGFAWGQSSHLFAFLYHICPTLQPIDVYCAMTHSDSTGADISHSATIRCTDKDRKNNSNSDNENDNDNDYIVMNVTGTTLLPGNAHSEPPVPKIVNIEVYGNDGSLHYGGNDRDPTSGQLEFRHADGTVEIIDSQFVFENLDNAGDGPESLVNFVNLCCGYGQQKSGNDENDETNAVYYTGADVYDGFRSIQTIDAMYKSHASGKPEKVVTPK